MSNMAIQPEIKSSEIKVVDKGKSKKLGSAIRTWSTLLALFIIWVFLSFASPYFLTVNNIVNIMLQVANIALIAVGMTFVIITAEIDLSVGSIEALAGAVVAIAMVKMHLPIVLALVLALLSGLACGLVSGFLTARFRFPSFVATLGMMGIARGFGLILTGGTAVYGFPKVFKLFGQGFVGPIPVAVIIAAVILLIAHIVLTRTRFGVNIYAVGGNADAAMLSGINVGRIKMTVLAINGMLAALAGIIMTSRLNSGQATIGEADVMDAIAAVVIGGTSLMGGTGTIRGTIIGVLIIGTIRNGLNILGVSSFWQQVCIGGIILLAVLIDQISKGQNQK